jgi:RNA polymerase sigma factor (sigma-70 family)
MSDQQATMARGLERVFSLGTGAGISEGQLLRRFVAGRDESAFSALVSLHGPMVLGVCRRVLGTLPDADDAFQATFLVLLRRAGAVQDAESLGPWLHGVAWRVASRARTTSARRRVQEAKAASDRSRIGDHGRSDDLDDVRAVLDEEIRRLPGKYRQPLVLCYLEGLTQEAAARRLRWKPGVLRGRLDRARLRLRGRLARRGIAPAAGLALMLLEPPAQAAVPASLEMATLAAASRELIVGKVAGAVAAEAAVKLAADVVRRQLLGRGALAFALVATCALTLAALSRLGFAGRIGDASPAIQPPQLGSSDRTGTNPPSSPNDKSTLDLRIVGPDRKPVPLADIEIATDKAPTASQIRRGKFVRPGSYGAYVQADAEGRLALELPQAPENFNLYITIPGYGPYWAGWTSETHTQPIPPQLTAELEPAWSVGGIVVDRAGKPIPGVSVSPSIEFKKRPGELHQLGAGARTKTDAAGKWRFDSVPVSMSEVHVEIDHPEFMLVRRQLSRREFGIERGQEPAARIVLEPGLTVTGRITDDAGRPIAGALVRTQAWNEARQATTGDDGTYKLVGCEPRPARIVVSAPGRATDVRDLNIEPGLGPVDFQMKPGGTVRVRVVDEQGRPVPKARIFFQSWRGRHAYFEFGNVNQYADEKGVWEWHEAPLDEFTANICPPSRMHLLQQPLIARAEDYVFRTSPALVVAGRVIDAETKKPIPEFRVIPGRRYQGGQLSWAREDSFLAKDGRYVRRETRGELAHVIRIEAEGYQAAVSRDIQSTEGSISVDFELTKGHNVAAKVVTPRNLPAAGAKVVLGVPGSQIDIRNGDIYDGSTFAAREVTDQTGKFHFPAQDTDFQLVITHPSGFAIVKSAPQWDLTRIIHLEPWARVEGTFRVGRTVGANVPLEIQVPRLDSYGNDVPRIFSQHDTTTGPDGRFVFERVIPGSGWIGRQITLVMNQGATEVTSSCRTPADFPAGKTLHIDLGGSGRQIVGRLQAPEGFTGKVRWNFAHVDARAVGAGPPEKSPYLMASVARDGSFRIDDVPAGDYMLNVMFMEDDVGALLNHRFQVAPAGSAVNPVDLGTLRLRKR